MVVVHRWKWVLNLDDALRDVLEPPLVCLYNCRTLLPHERLPALLQRRLEERVRGVQAVGQRSLRLDAEALHDGGDLGRELGAVRRGRKLLLDSIGLFTLLSVLLVFLLGRRRGNVRCGCNIIDAALLHLLRHLINAFSNRPTRQLACDRIPLRLFALFAQSAYDLFHRIARCLRMVRGRFLRLLFLLVALRSLAWINVGSRAFVRNFSRNIRPFVALFFFLLALSAFPRCLRHVPGPARENPGPLRENVLPRRWGWEWARAEA
mmetsp:Transcript_162930/g.522441  ORF Transcript_162930/g.522441 Transcript_162930/m.522441 type:complete len:264 (+) Transcript_162930:673-1464(+)